MLAKRGTPGRGFMPGTGMPHSAGANVFCWGEPILFKNRRPVAFKAGDFCEGQRG